MGSVGIIIEITQLGKRFFEISEQVLKQFMGHYFNNFFPTKEINFHKLVVKDKIVKKQQTKNEFLEFIFTDKLYTPENINLADNYKIDGKTVYHPKVAKKFQNVFKEPEVEVPDVEIPSEWDDYI